MEPSDFNEPKETPNLVEVGPITELPVEKQFLIASFNTQAEHMSHEQAIQMLKDLYRTMVFRDEAYKAMMARQWQMM